MANRAAEFIKTWTGRGNEKQETQQYWNDLLFKVLGAPEKMVIQYEKPVKINGQTKFIDAYLPGTRTLIEQKSLGVDLMKAEAQSDGMKLTPYEQGRRYGGYLPYDEQPRWIIDCNFEEIRVHDMKKPGDPPEVIKLEDMEKDYTRLRFMINTEDEHIQREQELSLKAGNLVGKIHDRFLEQYNDPMAKKTQNSLNILCTRLVFCLYAEDAGIFGSKEAFTDYLSKYEPGDIRQALINLFKVLDTPEDERADMYLSDELAAFPYCNGGLFANENIVIPKITQEIKDTLIDAATFNWSEISPTIFGAVFESTLNPETRRGSGAHFTSVRNIHRVVDPLFLDDLKAELADIMDIKVQKTKETKLKAYQNKLASLKFLDPACGSGNFLTETYLSLRRLENEVLRELYKGQIVLGDAVNPIKVGIDQFYGFEINDFAVTVAKTALWIAESQMMKETEDIVSMHLDFLPLKTNATIIECNALRIDWWRYVDRHSLSYIIGNPPFVGFTYMTEEQKADMQALFPKVKNLDLVCGWYKLAKDFIAGTRIQCAFVSTNSITQGETVARLWKFLDGIKINFAYRTFIWSSEASSIAHVHCVIIGFALYDRETKVLFDDKGPHIVRNINPYLCDAPNLIVNSRNTPLCDVSKMVYGNKPADGGNLIIEEFDYEEFIEQNPLSAKYVMPFVGAVEFLHNKKRYCLWLENADPTDIRKSPGTLERIAACKKAREDSVAAGIRKFAATPTLFAQRTQPIGAPCIVIPRVSSERRRYVPMGFLPEGTVVSDAVQVIPEATLYELGIITSNVHMAWMRTVCGRLKSDYRYSKDVVYNNFPWPAPTEVQKARIEVTAQGIIDARALYPDSSLADLYDELTMPIELRKAHQANDRAVMEAYGFSLKMTEQECVAELMKMYQKLAEEAK